jgi:ribosome-associated translation inhibitor RaiA
MTTYPIQMTLRGSPHSPALEAATRKRAEKLATFCSRITSCRVICDVRARPGRHDCDVMIRVHVPGNAIVVHQRCRDEDTQGPYQCLSHAFAQAERALKKYSMSRTRRRVAAGSRAVLLAGEP